MPPALIKAISNDHFHISHFNDSLTSNKATCAPPVPLVTLPSCATCIPWNETILSSGFGSQRDLQKCLS